MSVFAWYAGVAVAICAGLAAIMALIYLIAIAIRVASRLVGFSVGSILSLLFSTVLDIRFLSLVVVIFAMLAGYEGGRWSYVALALSTSLFIMATAYVVMFWLDLFDRSFLDKFGRTPQEKQFWGAVGDGIYLNIGFLGVVYIVLAYCATSYSYFLASVHARSTLDNVFMSRGPVTFGDFFSYTMQTTLEALPFDLKDKFDIQLSKVSVRRDAYMWKAFTVWFQLLFYSAFASLVAGIVKGKKE